MPVNPWTSLDTLGAVTVTAKTLPDLVWLIRQVRDRYQRFRITITSLEDGRLLVTVALKTEPHP